MVDQVEVFFIDHVKGVQAVAELLIEVKDDFADELVLHKKVEVGLVRELTLCPGAVVCDKI
mgnify:CR=1 FL=1